MAEEYQRNVGSGEQLGYGEATETNETAAAGEAVAASLDDQELIPDEDVEFVDDDYDESYTPAGEDEEVLFGDAEGLGRPMSLGQVRSAQAPIPTAVLRSLPTLAALANDPRTPDSIKAAYRLVVQRLAAEMEQRY